MNFEISQKRLLLQTLNHGAVKKPKIMTKLKKKLFFSGCSTIPIFSSRICPKDIFPCRKNKINSSGKNEPGNVKFVKLKLKISGPYSNGA